MIKMDLRLKIRDDVVRDIVILTIPKRLQQISSLLKCLSDIDENKYRLILVCNTKEDEKAKRFVKKIEPLIKSIFSDYDLVFNPERSIVSGRNKGLIRSIGNIRHGTRVTYMIDDDVIISNPKAVFNLLEGGLQHAAFVGYPCFNISKIPLKKQIREANKLVDAIERKKDFLKFTGYLEIEKPRRYTPFRGRKYENNYVLYGHVHGNLTLHFTRVLEKLHNEYGEEGLFSQSRTWYGENTEFNYRLQRHGFMGGYILHCRNKIEHIYNSKKWGLLFHNHLNVKDSPTRTLMNRNENMLRSYIYLSMESGTIPMDIPEEEFIDRFVDLLNSDYRFLRRSVQEFAKLLQVRYSTSMYLLGTTLLTNKEFEEQRRRKIKKIVHEVYKKDEIKQFIQKRKIEYETAPFKFLPYEQMTVKSFNAFLRYQHGQLKTIREEIFEFQK